MKILSILVLSLFLVALAGFAESGQESQFVGGGGPMPTLLFLDLADLNGAITDAGYPQVTQVLFANGGGGYGGQLDGLRIGGFGVGGDSLSVFESRSVSFDLAYGGMMIEKAAHTEDDFTVVLGTLLGFGSLDLRLVSHVPVTFENAINTPFVSSMSKDFFAIQPYIAFESKPYSWMWARFQLGFLWTLPDNWAFGEAEFAGPPRTLGGLTASLMIRFGGGSGVFPLDEMKAALDDLETEMESLKNELEPLEDELEPLENSDSDVQPAELED
jgi:hypothetical protein